MIFDQSTRLRLTDAARQGTAHYSGEYVDGFGAIVEAIRYSDLSIGRSISKTAKEARKSILLSTLYNDVTLSQFNDDGNKSLSWITSSKISSAFGEFATVKIKSELAPAVQAAVNRQEVGFAFSLPSSDESQRLLSDCAPLISDGRLLIRPDRHFSYTTGEVNSQGGRNWTLLTADNDADPDVWDASSETDGTRTYNEESFNEYFGTEKQVKRLTAMTLPFLAGVSFTTYAEILNDEDDMLIEFRAEMKKLAGVESEDVDMYRQDVLEPRVAKINRRFNQISKMKKLRAGGAFVATAALAIGSAASGGALGVVQALAGSAGLMLGAKELADHQKQASDLRDDPLYLLWKIRRAHS